MIIRAVDEYNEKGHLIYAENFVGAFVRGKTREEALAKFQQEIRQYTRWLGKVVEVSEVNIVQELYSDLNVQDADSDVLFESEKTPLTLEEYTQLKQLVLKSARDFQTMYESIPDKNGTVLPQRKTFYGNVPRTAEEMYQHTKSVNEYYFAEIEVDADNETDIYTCRVKGFELLESKPDFLHNTVYDGSYGEKWSLRKMCRRFVWHDRIHAKAMYKMACRLCGPENVKNTFGFER